MITRRGQEEDAAPKSWESNGAHRHGRRTSSKSGNAGWESPAARRRERRASYHLSQRPCDGRWPRPGAKLGCWLPPRCSPSIFSRLRLPPCLRPRPYVHTSSTYKQACVCVSRLALPARTGGDHTRPAVESRFTPPTIPVVGSIAGASGMSWTPGRRDAGLFFFASCATRPGRDDRSTSRRHTMRTHHHHYHLR